MVFGEAAEVADADWLEEEVGMTGSDHEREYQ